MNKFLEFKSAKSPNGHDWFYVKRTNDTPIHDSAVVITTIVKRNNDFEYLFLYTKRPPILAENKAQLCLESPAGLIGDIDKNESLKECINKELLEETGYKADKIFIELENSSTSAGLSSETITYATAIILNDKTEQKPISDGGIIVKREFVPCLKIYDFIQNINKTNSAHISVASATVCGLFFANLRLKNLT